MPGLLHSLGQAWRSHCSGTACEHGHLCGTLKWWQSEAAQGELRAAVCLLWTEAEIAFSGDFLVGNQASPRDRQAKDQALR